MSDKKECTSKPFIISQKDLDEAEPSKPMKTDIEHEKNLKRDFKHRDETKDGGWSKKTVIEKDCRQHLKRKNGIENDENSNITSNYEKYMINSYRINIHDDKLTFEEFCNKLNFSIPTSYKEHLIKLNSYADFIVNDEMLTWLGYVGKFHNMNENFKKLLFSINRNIEERENLISYNIKEINSTKYVEISLLNFIRAIVKMRTQESEKIHMFLSEFIVVKLYYSHYLLEKNNMNHEASLAKRNEKILKLLKQNEIVSAQQELVTLEKEREIESIRQEKENLLLEKNLELLRKTEEILTLEQKVENLLPNVVVPPNVVKKQQQFCLIDNGDNREGRVFKRQRYSFESAKQEYLSSHENSKIRLEVSYLPNAMYFFNNVRYYAKTNLKDKISIVGSKVKIISSDYNLNAFVQDMVEKFDDELKHHDYVVNIDE